MKIIKICNALFKTRQGLNKNGLTFLNKPGRALFRM